MGSRFLFRAVAFAGGGFAVAGGMAVAAASRVMGFVGTMFVEALGILPRMAFAGDAEEGKAGEEQGGSFHRWANLPVIVCLFNPECEVDGRPSFPSLSRRPESAEPMNDSGRKNFFRNHGASNTGIGKKSRSAKKHSPAAAGIFRFSENRSLSSVKRATQAPDGQFRRPFFPHLRHEKTDQIRRIREIWKKSESPIRKAV